MIILDIIIIILIFIVTILILCGIYSLCERKIFAIIQLRIGPSLLLMGIITPITDGIKLFLKFSLLLIGIENIYFFFFIFSSLSCIIFIWFFIPLGYIIFFDIQFSIFYLLLLDILINIMSTFAIGCLLFTNCFIYIASLRVLFITIIAEANINMIYITIFIIDINSNLTLKDIIHTQFDIVNYIFLGNIFTLIFLICFLIETSKLPFEYAESESELVAGIITEFSGLFFVIYSLLEINHTLLTSIIIIILVLGGNFLILKSILIILFFFCFIKALLCRIKITTAQTFILIILYGISFLLLCWNITIKITSNTL